MKIIIINIIVIILLTSNVKANPADLLAQGIAEILIPFILDEIILSDQEKRVKELKAEKNRNNFKKFFGISDSNSESNHTSKNATWEEDCGE